ncbi:hypothetical protein AX16_004401 [Volvariella volvacea WC 439]|nr:hypothetical protein AX16_004401 [Volvariella volvacea WC 439]
MGISGLLPALKCIQVTKHLSEFRGQTIGVDAYVWLHKGTYACATELALGKQTHKYVDYAMHRIRLLRHHNIEPYIVFDGGPLPAKQGTESDRKQKREENLTRGKLLTSQGKHSQAREYYVKCVDVTPQMAYQLIKALKAENVAYVVAPYEADAQLAYLERMGLVDAVLTEDSDLLVFGCRNVLFKLDAATNTVVSISRNNFSSVTASMNDANSISLVGWSDVQFRAMAILSGCDYLPSIPGVGLKTACNLLRKWKTVDQVIRVLNLEGKKSVPVGYADKFRLAEKCFQHQRVYDPSKGRLVHLTEIKGPWTDEDDQYVGSELDKATATGIAVGDIDPTSLLPMKDINPSFQPRVLRPLPGLQNQTTVAKEKGKAPQKPQSGGLLDFFGPNAVIPHAKRAGFSLASSKSQTTTGKASGKRTLAEVMDHDMALRKQPPTKTTPKLTQSKFFTRMQSSSENTAGESTPATSHPRRDKEVILVDDSDDDSPDAIELIEDPDDVSIVAQAEEIPDLEESLEPFDSFTVEQEDGYISPAFTDDGDVQDLSSPPRDGRTPKRRRPERSAKRVDDPEELEFAVDNISSPPSAAKPQKAAQFVPRPCSLRSRSLSPSRVRTRAAVNENAHSHPLCRHESLQGSVVNADLRDCFGDESDVPEELDTQPTSISQSSSSLTPPTPATPADVEDISGDDSDLDDPEEREGRALTLRREAVASGWRDKWALSKSQTPMLKRRETNVTPAGRHRARNPPLHLHTPPSAPSKPSARTLTRNTLAHSRRSLDFLETNQSTGTPR